MIPIRACDWLTATDYAHRGMHSPGVAENSRSAAQAAIAAGFGIECDVQMSRDNVPLIFHDWELDRLTDAQGKVSSRSARELVELTLKDSQDTIWTLRSFLDCVAGRVPILLEIKSLPHFDVASACIAVASELRDYNGLVAVMSFDPRVGDWFAKHAPLIIRGLVTTDTYDHGFLSIWRQPKVLERAKPDFLASDIRDVPNTLSQIWREAGRPLLSWTVRTPELRAQGEAHCDALIAEGAGL